jgi:hypothetical protein
MDIETSTCISVEHLQLLQSLSETYRMPFRTFVSTMISFAAESNTLPPKTFTRLTYRKRGTQWKRLHLVLFADEYEFFMDIRKVWKMSLAKVIAFCLDNVLDQFLRFLNSKIDEDDYYVDSYRYRNYSFEFFREENIQTGRFYWGIHPDIIRKTKHKPRKTLIF